MRQKTFPATIYSGNSPRRLQDRLQEIRLQEIREGLKQPPKTPAPGRPWGRAVPPPWTPRPSGARQQQQQQTRTAPKFGPYQKALREIRYSLLPFANELGPSAAAEVNQQMLQ